MRRSLFALFLFFSTACFYTPISLAETVDTYTFKNDADRSRAVALAKTLRCVQCQNQNLVESNSHAAFQLRNEVYKMVEEGKSDEQIKVDLIARFGDFVLYQPPLNWKTYALWGLPPFLLLLAFCLAWTYLRKAKNILPQPLAIESELQAVQNKQQFANCVENQTACNTQASVWNGLILALVFILPISYYAYSGRFQQTQQSETAFQQAMQKRAEQTGAERKETFVEAIQNRLRQNPNDGQGWFELGQAYMQANDFENALESYSRASILLGRKPMILGAAATALYYQSHQKLTPQVQEWIDDALRQDPNDSASLALLASDAFAHKNYDQALTLWQQILDSGRTDIERRAIIQAMENTERLRKVK